MSLHESTWPADLALVEPLATSQDRTRSSHPLVGKPAGGFAVLIEPRLASQDEGYSRRNLGSFFWTCKFRFYALVQWDGYPVHDELVNRALAIVQTF